MRPTLQSAKSGYFGLRTAERESEIARCLNERLCEHYNNEDSADVQGSLLAAHVNHGQCQPKFKETTVLCGPSDIHVHRVVET